MPVSGEVSGAGWATRLRRLAPYFLGAKRPWAIATLATIVAAATEPLIPALLKPLLDQGFTGPGERVAGVIHALAEAHLA